MNATLLVLALCQLPSPLDDLHRFPSHQTAALNYQFAEKTVTYLEKELRYSSDPPFATYIRYETPLALNSPEREHLTRTHGEAVFCRDCWQALSLASDVKMSYEARVRWLEDLRLLLEDASWFDGEMPAAAPWWRMRVVK